ncbi:hypothetical protein AOXY_G60 [Acipenser oxyrinchus oxyrinchus]|uniref:Ig-like domain-containing protein n=1 Tax=Acipenser oxyrinchus oxyrinchus TaxID=40147 RepID=A0AAD8GIT5_ACIOX|nr:hypothetical protein AOXY_G60 [Acipenser oxyrinchus oxyrinchus]
MTWIFFWILFPVVVKVTNEVPGGGPEVPEILVYLGDSVSLPGAKGNQTRLIEWTFKNSSGYFEDVLTLYSASPESPDIFAKYKKRISVLPNGSFTLNHVEWQDGGHYERRINQKERQQYWLRVLELPGDPSIIKNQDILTCNVTSYNSVTWTKDDQNVPEDFEISNNTLKLPSNASESRLCGVYKCQAQFTKHNKTSDLLLIVFSNGQKAIVIIEICAFVMNLLSVPSITMLFWRWEERGFGLMHWWLDIGVVGDLVSPILNIAGLSLWIHEDNNLTVVLWILMVIAISILILTIIERRQVQLQWLHCVINIVQYLLTLSVILFNIYKESPCSFFMQNSLFCFLTPVFLVGLLWACTFIYCGVATGNMKFTRTAENEKNETLHKEEGQVCPVSS